MRPLEPSVFIHFRPVGGVSRRGERTRSTAGEQWVNTVDKWKSALARYDEPVLIGNDDELRAVAGVELGEQTGDVRLRRQRGEHELVCDLRVGEPAADEGQHFS